MCANWALALLVFRGFGNYPRRRSGRDQRRFQCSRSARHSRYLEGRIISDPLSERWDRVVPPLWGGCGLFVLVRLPASVEFREGGLRGWSRRSLESLPKDFIVEIGRNAVFSR